MDSLQCGFAQRDITPEPGTVFLDGYGFRLLPADGVRDPIFVKACIIELGDKQFALLSFDICGMSPEVYDYIASHIEAMTGFERKCFALCCTHTHAAPTSGVLKGLPLNWDWLAHVSEAASSALREAQERLRPGEFRLTIADQPLQAAYNRRFREPIDRRIHCAVFVADDGELCGVLTSASCHPVANTSQKISADYISVLYDEIEASWPGVPVVFTSGRGGDIDPYQDEMMDRETLLLAVGHEFATAVVDSVTEHVARGKSAVPPDGLQVIESKVRVPMLPYASPEECEREVERLTRTYRHEHDPVQKHIVLRALDYQRDQLRRSSQEEDPDLEVTLQMLVLGRRAVFVFLPFEILTLTGHAVEALLLAEGFSAEAIYVVSNANSVNGYLATRAEYALGGYEFEESAVWYGVPRCVEASEDAVLAGVARMIEELDDGLCDWD